MASPPGLRPGPMGNGHYVVERELGRGGMGVVYLARDVRLDRPVAVKTLPEDLALDPGRLAQFQREAKVLASLNHPNIATIHGIEEDGRGSRFLVLEWVNGTTLSDVLRSGPLPIATAVPILTQIAEALAVAHEAGVVHRDLKPRNVMILPGHRVKVLDFGLARRMLGERDRIAGHPGALDTTISSTADSMISSLDASHVLLGTAAYMSPERILGEAEDLRGDIFTFGGVAYECLSGQPAFHATSILGVLTRVVKADPDWSALPADTPVELRTLLAGCLQKEKERRPAGMDRVLATIGRIRDRRRSLSQATEHAAPGEGGIPNNLPKVLPSFVGREHEATHGWHLLDRARLLTLIGPGGSGKTRLALRIAELALDGDWQGVWLVRLAPIADPEHVPDAVAEALLVGERGGPVTDAIVERLRPLRALVLLDNCEHVHGAASILARELIERCPSLTLIATSREPLGIAGENLLPVSSMAVPPQGRVADLSATLRFDSVRLFVERAADAGVPVEMTADQIQLVAEICRRVDGIPLAIELAAARVRVLSLAEIASRLDRQLRLLKGEGTVGGEPHHATLKSTILWSVDLLGPDEQAAFRALAVFAGGWDLASATTVLGLAPDELDALDVVATLVNRSLAVAEGSREGRTRYRYLEPIRQCALELLAESSDAETVRRRHLLHFVAGAKEAHPHLQGSEQPIWLERLEPDHQNLLAALERCTQSPELAETAQQMAHHLARFWLVRGHPGIGIAMLRRVVALPDGQRPTMSRGLALYSLAALQFHSSEPNEPAIGYVSEALGVFREIGDRLWEARCLATLGGEAAGSKRLDEATDWLMQAAALLKELGAGHKDRGAIASNLGSIAWDRNDLPLARKHYLDAMALMQEAGDLTYLARVHVSLLFITTRLGDLDAARHHAKEALQIQQRLKARTSVSAGALLALAELDLALRKPEAAAHHLGASDAILNDTGEVDRRDGWWRGHDGCLERIRGALGNDESMRLQAEGRALPYGLALARAIADVSGET